MTYFVSLCFANQIGDGPMFLIFSVNVVQISAHLGPWAADRLYISILAGSIVSLARSFFTYSILRAENLLPSR